MGKLEPDKKGLMGQSKKPEISHIADGPDARGHCLNPLLISSIAVEASLTYEKIPWHCQHPSTAFCSLPRACPDGAGGPFTPSRSASTPRSRGIHALRRML